LLIHQLASGADRLHFTPAHESTGGTP
jgi:hypothetical protein